MPVKRLPADFYASATGRQPVREWLKDLDPEDRKIVGEDIKDVEFAWPIDMPLCRSLKGGLWEVRSALTQGRIARVLFCVREGRMVLLHELHQEDAADAAGRARPGNETDEGHHMNAKGKIGSSFDDFLKDEGIYEEVTARAVKRVIARQLDALMRAEGLTKVGLAKRMQTSRAQLDRLLDPDNQLTLGTLARAARAVGRELRIELV